MNSEPFDIDQRLMGQIKENKSFNFVKLYKCAAETKVVQSEKNNKLSKKANKSNKNFKAESNTAKRSRSPNKIKKKHLDLSEINTVESNSLETTRTSGKNILTSSSNNKGEPKVSEENGVKSIMKAKSDINPLPNITNISTPNSKPKKRNKSVSFMLEDTDEVVVKRSKSNNSNNERKNEEVKLKNMKFSTKIYKRTKILQSKENQNLNEVSTEIGNKKNYKNVKESTLDIPDTKEVPPGANKTINKVKKSKISSEKDVETIENHNEITEEQISENKLKKSKKKKRKTKCVTDNNTEAEGDEPANKTRKKDLKPEAIAKGLENLNIGDNAHTLTSLLDEMTVVDKSKNKKERQKQKRDQEKSTIDSEDNQEEPCEHSSKTEEKVRVKWSNRKWNKDAKGVAKSHLRTSVVVENLPIKIMCNFKTLLSEYFSKFGTIAGIGVAEAYPTEELKPVFTTTVFFQEEEAATKALEEDNAAFEGSRVRVRRPQPPAATTLVVRARALSEQALSSLFSSAGRVRSIRQLIKGKKSMSTAFVEFDGPEAVERALALAEDATINGKKIYVSKFEIRKKGKSSRSEKDSIMRR